MNEDKELDAADDIEASGYFNLAVLNNGVTARVCDASQAGASPSAPRTNLLAISNVFGWAVVGTSSGFSLFSLAQLRESYRSAKQRTEATPSPHCVVQAGDGNGGITFLRIGFADKLVIAAGSALQGGVGVWRLKSLVDGSSTAPLHVFPASSSASLLDVLPNPADRPELLALLHADGQITMVNMETKTTLGRFGSNLTAACWSVRGKQIVCGDAQGNLTQFTPEGSAKTVTAAPSSLRERSMDVIDIRWVENAVFFVTFLDRDNPMDVSPFILTRAKDGSVTYTPFYDPLMVENTDRPEARFNVWLKNWSPLKHLLLVANATSNTIGHIGQGPVEEGSANIVWSQVKNDLYTTLPLETFPLGVELDLTAADAPAPEESAGEVATPILWALATDGTLSAWRVLNSQGGQYSGISAAKDVVADEEAGAPASSAPAAEQAAPTANAGLAGSPFASGTTSTPPAFGKPAFGAGKSFSGSPVAFGGTSSLGKSTFAPGFGQASFGASASPASAAPAFGQSATFGAAGKTGFSGFGTPAATPAPVSASAGSGFAGFSAKPASFAAGASPSAEGSSGAKSPFSSAEPSRSATPAFASSTPATFGSSTFGQPANSTTSAFGSASNPAPFGTASSTGKPAFGATSSFGSTTFGASATPSAFGAPSDASKPSGFGAFGSPGTATGFGAFGSGSKASTASGFSFGSNGASNDSAKSPFGQPATTSAFGGLRDSVTSAASQQAAPTAKPAGLDDSEVDQLEPESVADQQGGAMDFGTGSKATKASADIPLRMDGFGFGSKESAVSGSDSKPPASPSLFGSFGKVADNVKEIEERQKSPEPALKTLSSSSTSPFAAKASTSGFGAFGQAASSASASPFAPKSAGDASADNKAAEKPAFSFANVAKPSGQDSKTVSDANATSKPASGFGSTGFGAPSAFSATAFGKPSAFGKPAGVKTEGKDQGKPSGFSGFSAFGQPSPLGGGESKSPFSFASSAAPNKSAEGGTSGSPASKPSGFAGFASPSAGQTSSSPFGSPSASPSATKTSAFGQPGFFSGFGQKPKDVEKEQAKQEPRVKKEDDEESQGAGQKTSPVASKPAEAVVTKPTSEAEPRGESSGDDGSQQEGDEWEQVQGESHENDGAEDDHGNDDDEGDEDEGDEDEEEEEEEGEEEEEHDEEEAEEEQENDEEAADGTSGENDVEEAEANVTRAESAPDEEGDLTPASERSQGEDPPSPASPPSPTPVALSKPAVKPSADIAKPSDKPALSFGAPARTESSPQSAWSFGALTGKTAPTPAEAPSGATDQPASNAPTFSFAKPQAEAAKVAAASPFAPKETAEKAPAPPTFGFGQPQQGKPAAPTAKALEPSKPPNAFSFSSGPTAAAGRPAEPPKPFGFSHLNKAAPRTSSPLAAMPSFQPASPQTSQTSFDLSNVSSAASASVASPVKPSGFGVSAAQTPTASIQPFFSNAQTPKAEQQPTKTRPGLEQRKSDSTLTVLNAVPPKLSTAGSSSAAKQAVGKDTVNVFVTMQDQMEALKASASQCLDFFHSVQPARLPADGTDDDSFDPLDVDAEAWSMGDLPRLKELAVVLAEALTDITQHATDEEKAAKSLEGSLLKTKAKAEEISRHLKARHDPQVARMVKVRQLGPEQLENQTRIRLLNQNVNEALEELETVIARLKEKVLEQKMGRNPLKAPSLDSIHRAIRNITSGLQSRILDLDDAALRLDMLTLSTRSPQPGSSSSKRVGQQGSEARASPAVSPSVERPNVLAPRKATATETEKKVERLLAAEAFGQKLKVAWLADGRKEAPLNTSANGRL